MFRRYDEDFDDALVLATIYGQAYSACRSRGNDPKVAYKEAADACRNFIQTVKQIDEEERTRGSGGKG
jgi:hypothetical protein